MQSRINCFKVWESAPVLGIFSISGHGKAIGNNVGRSTDVLLKPLQTVKSSEQEANSRVIGKPLVAIEAEKA
jgi:hypothetical protein